MIDEHDRRNVTDEFKGKHQSEIITILDEHDEGLHIAIENLERDFNMGTIVRSANAFGVRHVHVVGRRQWNKRGAMATEKYLHVYYYQTTQEFTNEMKRLERSIVAIDNVYGARDLSQASLPRNAVLVFGSEGSGISQSLIQSAVQTVAIEQFGSTRSVNVGVAAGIVMYEWNRRHRLN